MKQTVAHYIAEHKLLVAEGPVLVAVSGGADSVALLHLLHELGYHVIALHCNFHLRGEESDRDQRFVETLCERFHIALHTVHFNTREYAATHKQSIEMAARELRYDWFRAQQERLGAQAIAVGHHLDDQAETLLLNLLRGTGIRGMAAMHPRQGNIIRPLLGVNRSEIERYLAEHHLDFITDSSNLEADVLRNRIRLQVMPLLCELQPAASRTLARAAEHIGQALPYYIKGVEESMEQTGFMADRLRTDTFLQSGSPILLLHEWLSPHGFNAAQVQDIHRHLDGQTGKMWESHTHRLLLDRQQLLLTEKESDHTAPKIEMKEVDTIGPTGPEFAYVDANRIEQPLTIRPVQTGDWFVPFGMTGRKLVSDFLTDRKLSRFQKERQWVLCSGSDIVWVIGLRADNRFRITTQTKRIIQISLQGPENNEYPPQNSHDSFFNFV